MVFDRIDKNLQPWQVITFVVIAVGIGAILGLAMVPHLRDIAGMDVFDLRFSGYDFNEAVELLEALGEEGRSYYSANYLFLDTLFIPFLFLAITSVFLWLTRPNQRYAVPLSESIRLVVVALAFVAMASDLVENIGVWVILGTADDPSSGIVALSGVVTGVKWLALSGAIAALVATIIIALIRGVSSRESAAA